MKGTVTDIQRFSLHDGPGIRTTVFMKGCNLSCAWCHNPETIRSGPELLYYGSNCIHCGECAKVCPAKAHRLEEGRHVFDRSLCGSCGRCAGVCFSGACLLSGKIMEVEEVLEEVMQDEAYYHRSGGGITVSGGEAFMQAGFVAELLKRCRGQGIHTAVETNLSFPWERMEAALVHTDLVMLDIKHWDTQEHRKWTNLGNERVLDNIRRLTGAEIPYIVRTPVIPGVNDSAECISSICRFLVREGKAEHYELLRFNPFGGAKYQALEKHDAFAGAAVPDDAIMLSLNGIIRDFGLAAAIG
ncbi:glycyl-radical enzyme activating protein [Paenibacillus sp. S150]|uniref:glycyl-radical enzyme activating protein n=1 Tax=Paenibacillus sp. S150 TaxID=2749826 RepID=UPI001C5917E1|nr:glycyl-radical enzyme activating protein [Paenibacillus sp. S150]MBW4081557.1 glycyl-radical enzyme activating protein [Paenibacillus sp. S150]